MARLAAAGDGAAAVAVYERLAERLRRELRVAPSAPTRALVAEIRGGATAAERPAARRRRSRAGASGRRSSGATPRATGCSPRSTTSAAASGACVVISGEPGIGKSRLAAEAARAAHDAGATVLAGRCHEEPVGPFGPFVEALRPPGRAARRARRRPRARRGCGCSTRSPPLLGRAAAERPVLLVLDDLHWADPATLRLLAHLAAARSRRRCCCWGRTARPTSGAATRSPRCSPTCGASRAPSGSRSRDLTPARRSG